MVAEYPPRVTRCGYTGGMYGNPDFGIQGAIYAEYLWRRLAAIRRG